MILMSGPDKRQKMDGLINKNYYSFKVHQVKTVFAAGLMTPTRDKDFPVSTIKGCHNSTFKKVQIYNIFQIYNIILKKKSSHSHLNLDN